MRPTAAQVDAERQVRAQVERAHGRVIHRRIEGGDVVLVVDVEVPEFVVEGVSTTAVVAMAERLRAAMEAVQPEPHHNTSARLLSPEEFGQAVGVSRAAVYRMIRRGMPAPKVPNVGRRVDLEQGRKWMLAVGLKRKG